MKCHTGKIQYKTRDEAIKANCKNGRRKGIYQNVYRCNICNDFHLTSRRINGIIKKKVFYQKEHLNYLIEKMKNIPTY
jgi:hypothetical protein